MGFFDGIFRVRDGAAGTPLPRENKDIRILVVEDDLLIAKLLETNIRDAGYNVTVTFDGESAWKMAPKIRPDLVIQDIGLPGMDGYALCDLIKRHSGTKNARIIMLTGKNLVGDMEKAFRCGADIYINKPFVWERMLKHIRKLLGQEPPPAQPAGHS